LRVLAPAPMKPTRMVESAMARDGTTGKHV
jgi:hypothetical protein